MTVIDPEPEVHILDAHEPISLIVQRVMAAILMLVVAVCLIYVTFIATPSAKLFEANGVVCYTLTAWSDPACIKVANP